MGKGRNGGGRTAGGRPGARSGRSIVAGVPAAPATAEAVREANAPAQPVAALLGPTTVDNRFGNAVYSFQTTSGNRIEMTVKQEGFEDDFSVEFSVNNTVRRGMVPDREANAVTIRLMQLMRQDAAGRPDRTTYRVNASTQDGYGMRRAMAYEAMGFSRPFMGGAGGYQYAVVRGGKLKPDNTRLEEDESSNGLFPTVVEVGRSKWAAATTAVRNQR